MENPCPGRSGRSNEMSTCRKLRAAGWKWGEKREAELLCSHGRRHDEKFQNVLKIRRENKDGRNPWLLLAASSARRIKSEVSY